MRQLTESKKKEFKKMFDIGDSKAKAKQVGATPSKGVQAVAVVPAVKKRRKAVGVLTMYPSKKFITLLWEAQTGLTADATQSSFGVPFQIWLNNIADPSVNTSQYAVQGYDQLTTVYGKYKVYGAHVLVTASNPTLDGGFVGYRFHKSGDPDGISGEPMAPASMKKWTTIKPINNTGSQVIHYERYFDIKAIEGLTKLQFNADIDNYTGVFQSAIGPLKKPYFEVAYADSSGVTQPKVSVIIKVTYYVQIFDRFTLANSTIPV